MNRDIERMAQALPLAFRQAMRARERDHDRLWFDKNPARCWRLREPLPGEIDAGRVVLCGYAGLRLYAPVAFRGAPDFLPDLSANAIEWDDRLLEDVAQSLQHAASAADFRHALTDTLHREFLLVLDTRRRVVTALKRRRER
jgi:hypothetical protein